MWLSGLRLTQLMKSIDVVFIETSAKLYQKVDQVSRSFCLCDSRSLQLNDEQRSLRICLLSPNGCSERANRSTRRGSKFAAQY